eukprot:scaffold597_cov242-Prasinococcus_capsulatus_cf.AAC.3
MCSGVLPEQSAASSGCDGHASKLWRRRSRSCRHIKDKLTRPRGRGLQHQARGTLDPAARRSCLPFRTRALSLIAESAAPSRVPDVAPLRLVVASGPPENTVCGGFPRPAGREQHRHRPSPVSRAHPCATARIQRGPGHNKGPARRHHEGRRRRASPGLAQPRRCDGALRVRWPAYGGGRRAGRQMTPKSTPASSTRAAAPWSVHSRLRRLLRDGERSVGRSPAALRAVTHAQR